MAADGVAEGRGLQRRAQRVVAALGRPGLPDPALRLDHPARWPAGPGVAVRPPGQRLDIRDDAVAAGLDATMPRANGPARVDDQLVDRARLRLREPVDDIVGGRLLVLIEGQDVVPPASRIS
jgi:hypothetical protein